MRRLLGRSANAALSVLAGLGVLCVVVTLAGVLFDVRALVFTSGSMSPTIQTGALGLARPVEAADLEVGDVVSVPVDDSRVTHRITDITLEGDQATLVLKGDANTVEDADPYPVDSADRVFFHVPKLGYAVDALSGPVGIFLGGMLAAVLLYLVFRPTRRDTERGTGRHHAAVLAVLIMGAPAVLTAGRVAPTTAAWSDAGIATGGSLAARTVAAPAASCGTLTVGTTRLKWTPVPGATSYTLHYGRDGGTTEVVGSSTSSKTFSGLAMSGVFSVQANINYGSTTWTSVTSNQLRYTVVLLAVGICTNA